MREQSENNHSERQEQIELLKAFTGTIQHYFGSWEAIFDGVRDARNPNWITYPLEGLLCAGVLMFLFRLGSRRQINYQMRDNGPSQSKFEAWFEVENIPHGDTLNYGFKTLDADEVQEAICQMVERLIRKKVLYRWRLFDNFLIAVDGTGMLTFREKHCEYCLTKKLRNGETLYYHPILEAQLITANGFAFSIMTEFIENTDPLATKQDCELKAFYRLAERLKKRFPRLPICLLLDGLFAGGPTFQLCEDYNWRYMIVLQDDDLPNVHRSYDVVLPFVPENHKRLLLGIQREIVQDYRWVTHIEYIDSEKRSHRLNLLTCEETKPNRQGDTSTTTHKWLIACPLGYQLDPHQDQCRSPC